MTQRLPDSLVNGCMVMAKGIFISSMRNFSAKRQGSISFMQKVVHCLCTAPTQDLIPGEAEVIIPYTLGEAQKWAMEHMDGDAYEAEFGEVDE